MHSAVDALKEFEAVTRCGNLAVNIAVAAVCAGVGCVARFGAGRGSNNAVIIVTAGITTDRAYAVIPSVVFVINYNCITATPILLVLCFGCFPFL